MSVSGIIVLDFPPSRFINWDRTKTEAIMKKIYLLAALAFLASTLSGQTVWDKHPENPVLELEPGGDDGASRGGPVAYYDDTFHMWYSKGHTDTIDAHIGYATSPDGIHWTKHGDNPVLETGPEGSWDKLQCFFPTVLIRDNVFHMWYLGRPGGSDSNERKIGHATSSDGIHWVKDPQNPVLDRGPEGSPDAYYIMAISASHDNSLFHLWYGANNGVDDFYYTCHATSEDGSVWSKDPENPVLTGDIWDTPMCLPGPALFDGSGFQMWYTGGESGPTRKIGYATSADGTNWVKPSENPILTGGGSGEWDEGPVAIRGIVYNSTIPLYLMWYSGTDGIGYATSFDETGIFTDKHLMTGHINLYPNPVTDLLNVRTGLSECHLVEIASVNGQVVYSKTMDRPGYQIDLSSCDDGIYFIIIRSRDFVITRKIMKL
jgi:hypothetical protein